MRETPRRRRRARATATTSLGGPTIFGMARLIASQQWVDVRARPVQRGLGLPAESPRPRRSRSLPPPNAPPAQPDRRPARSTRRTASAPSSAVSEVQAVRAVEGFRGHCRRGKRTGRRCHRCSWPMVPARCKESTRVDEAVSDIMLDLWRGCGSSDWPGSVPPACGDDPQRLGADVDASNVPSRAWVHSGNDSAAQLASRPDLKSGPTAATVLSLIAKSRHARIGASAPASRNAWGWNRKTAKKGQHEGLIYARMTGWGPTGPRSQTWSATI